MTDFGRRETDKMASGGGNGRMSNLQILDTLAKIAQFMIIPILWLIWQMNLDIVSIRERLTKIEVRVESHSETSISLDQARTGEVKKELKDLRNEIEYLQERIDAFHNNTGTSQHNYRPNWRRIPRE